MPKPSRARAATCDEVIIKSFWRNHLCKLTNPFSHSGPARRIKNFHLWQEYRDGRAALFERFKRMNTEPEFGEIEAATFAVTQCGNNRIVEHAATIQVAGRDKKCSRQPEFAKNRRCDLLVVCVAVVKSNGKRSSGKRTALQSRDRFGERDHVEVPLHPAHARFKFCGGRLAGQQRIGRSAIPGERSAWKDARERPPALSPSKRLAARYPALPISACALRRALFRPRDNSW